MPRSFPTRINYTPALPFKITVSRPFSFLDFAIRGLSSLKGLTGWMAKAKGSESLHGCHPPSRHLEGHKTLPAIKSKYPSSGVLMSFPFLFLFTTSVRGSPPRFVFPFHSVLQSGYRAYPWVSATEQCWSPFEKQTTNHTSSFYPHSE